jgi:Ca2+-binding EF-hand superfamily protein
LAVLGAVRPTPAFIAAHQALDNHLKRQKKKFKELFQEFDRDRSGHLDSDELGHMMSSLMPKIKDNQLK